MTDRRPVLPRGVRLHWDTVRDVPVLLGPERAIFLDPTAHAVLSNIDGRRTEGQIVDRLSAHYNAPAEQIRTDVADLLDDLFGKRLMDFGD